MKNRLPVTSGSIPIIAFELPGSENGGLEVGMAAVPTAKLPFSESSNSKAIMGISTASLPGLEAEI